MAIAITTLSSVCNTTVLLSLNSTRRFIGNNLVAPPSSDDTATTGPRGGGGLASARHNNASGPLRGRGGDFDDSDSENSINRNFNWIAGFMNPNDPTRRRGEAGVNRAADQDDDPSDFFRLRVPNFDGTGRKYYKVSEVVDMNRSVLHFSFVVSLSLSLIPR
jgi:hypothetical protein